VIIYLPVAEKFALEKIRVTQIATAKNYNAASMDHLDERK
jgi:hypothetical protein